MSKIRSTVLIVAALVGGAPIYLPRTQSVAEPVSSSQEKSDTTDAQLNLVERKQQDL
jgi:hypothetical protein